MLYLLGSLSSATSDPDERLPEQLPGPLQQPPPPPFDRPQINGAPSRQPHAALPLLPATPPHPHTPPPGRALVRSPRPGSPPSVHCSPCVGLFVSSFIRSCSSIFCGWDDARCCQHSSYAKWIQSAHASGCATTTLGRYHSQQANSTTTSTP